jgi:hypothetical protein
VLYLPGSPVALARPQEWLIVILWIALGAILYARSAGIPIEEADLDVLRESVFDADEPDLGPALVRAVERLEEHLGRNFLNSVLDQL